MKRILSLLLILVTMVVILPQTVSAIEESYSVTLNFDDLANRVSHTRELQIWEQNGITFTNDDTWDRYDPIQLRGDSTVSIIYPRMTKIVFVGGREYDKFYIQDSIEGKGNVVRDGWNVIIEFTNPVNSLNFICDGAIYLKSITVYYDPPSETECTHDFDDLGFCKLCDIRKIWLEVSRSNLDASFWQKGCSINIGTETIDMVMFHKNLYWVMIPDSATTAVLKAVADGGIANHHVKSQSIPENANCFCVTGMDSHFFTDFYYSGYWYKYPCVDHVWDDGQCSNCLLICNHDSYENYACATCGKACSHNFNSNNICTICTYGCDHSNAFYQPIDESQHGLICSGCEDVLEIGLHSTTAEGGIVPSCTNAGYCTVCGEYGKVLPHDFEDRICTVCGTVNIIYVNGIAIIEFPDSASAGLIEDAVQNALSHNAAAISIDARLDEYQMDVLSSCLEGKKPVIHFSQMTKEEVDAVFDSSDGIDVLYSDSQHIDGFFLNGSFDAAIMKDGYYEISNAGQLFWFAKKVNGGERTINGKLIADIDLGGREWVAICKTDIYRIEYGSDYGYAGVFDGNGYTISNYVIVSAEYIDDSVGFFGTVSGTVRNLGVENVRFKDGGKDMAVGAIVGQLITENGLVENCYVHDAVISPNDHIIGGIAGCVYEATLRNCYVLDSEIAGYSERFGYVVGDTVAEGGNFNVDRMGTVSNCYTDGTVVFSSRRGFIESCGSKADASFASGEVTYLLGSEWGQIVGTGVPVPGGPTVYKIVCDTIGYSNDPAGSDIHNYVNGFCHACDACQIPKLNEDSGYYQIENAGQLFWFAQQVNNVGNREINGILINDIDLESRPWIPIGTTGENNNNFRGVFDGQGHTITGLKVIGSKNGIGFFGEVRTGTVKNFTIYGDVEVSSKVAYVGGVIGSTCGVNVENDLERNGATIQNITSYVNLTTKAHGIGRIGGFVGYANHETLIENCAWYGTFDLGGYRAEAGVAGFIGRIQENSDVTIKNCGAYGTVKINYKKGDYNGSEDIFVCGFLGWSVNGTNESDLTDTVIENCLFAGSVELGENTTDKIDYSAFGCLSEIKSITNCYYLGENGLPGVNNNSTYKPTSAELVSVERSQLESGEVAYLLGEAFGQKDLTQENSLPVVGGAKVYKYIDGYSNEFKFGFVDYTEDEVVVSIPEAGEYLLIFADYKGDILNDIEFIPVIVAADKTGEITQALTIGEGDKIMLWFDLTNITPLCDVLCIEE